MFTGSCTVAIFLLTLGWAPDLAGLFIDDEALVSSCSNPITFLSCLGISNMALGEKGDSCTRCILHLRAGFRNQRWYVIWNLGYFLRGTRS